MSNQDERLAVHQILLHLEKLIFEVQDCKADIAILQESVNKLLPKSRQIKEQKVKRRQTPLGREQGKQKRIAQKIFDPEKE